MPKMTPPLLNLDEEIVKGRGWVHDFIVCLQAHPEYGIGPESIQKMKKAFMKQYGVTEKYFLF